MEQRALAAQEELKKAQDDYVRNVASTGDPAEQIAKAQALLDTGSITAAEFQALKAEAVS